MCFRFSSPIIIVLFSISIHAVSKVTPENIAKGKNLYTINCMNCHGDHLDGNGPAGQYLNPKPRDLINDKFQAGDSPDKVYGTVSKGLKNTTMVGFSHIPKLDRWKIVHYILSIRAEKSVESSSDTTAEDKKDEIAEIMRKVKAQKNLQLGGEVKKLVGEYRCLQCHKSNNSLNTPRLHGASKEYLIEQLWAFKEGRRRNVFMQSVTSKMKRSDIIKIASYFSNLNRCDVRIEEIKSSGNIRRGKIRAALCIGCHTKKSPMNAPLLDGQNAFYIAAQLRNIKSGKRENPFMNAVVQTLSDQDIKDVASYFGSLDTCPKKRGAIKKEKVKWLLPSHIVRRLHKESKNRGHSIEQIVHAALSAYLD